MLGCAYMTARVSVLMLLLSDLPYKLLGRELFE